jgi:hypothetical protein
MIAGAGACHVKQVPFAIIDLFEIRIVRDILDALLRGNNLIVARHYRDGTKLKPFSQMHGPYRELARRDLDFVAEFDCRETGSFN